MRIREGLLVPVVCGALFVCGLVGPVLPSVAQQMADETRQQTGFPVSEVDRRSAGKCE